MISTDYGFIFIHIAKTGGNAVQTLLLPHSDDSKRVWRHQDGVQRFEITGPVTKNKHATLDDYAQALGDGLRNYKVMATVRHPFDRAVSAYFSPNRWFRENEPGKWVQVLPVWSEPDFVDFISGKDLLPICNSLTVGGVVQRPDFTLRFSRLQSDLDSAAKALGLPCLDPLPHLNRSLAGNDLRNQVLSSRHLADYVEAQFQQDMDLFEFDRFETAHLAEHNI